MWSGSSSAPLGGRERFWAQTGCPRRSSLPSERLPSQLSSSSERNLCKSAASSTNMIQHTSHTHCTANHSTLLSGNWWRTLIASTSTIAARNMSSSRRDWVSVGWHDNLCACISHAPVMVLTCVVCLLQTSSVRNMLTWTCSPSMCVRRRSARTGTHTSWMPQSTSPRRRWIMLASSGLARLRVNIPIYFLSSKLTLW